MIRSVLQYASCKQLHQAEHNGSPKGRWITRLRYTRTDKTYEAARSTPLEDRNSRLGKGGKGSSSRAERTDDDIGAVDRAEYCALVIDASDNNPDFPVRFRQALLVADISRYLVASFESLLQNQLAGLAGRTKNYDVHVAFYLVQILRLRSMYSRSVLGGRPMRRRTSSVTFAAEPMRCTV